jgi:hypothetical protein
VHAGDIIHCYDQPSGVPCLQLLLLLLRSGHWLPEGFCVTEVKGRECCKHTCSTQLQQHATADAVAPS